MKNDAPARLTPSLTAGLLIVNAPGKTEQAIQDRGSMLLDVVAEIVART